MSHIKFRVKLICNLNSLPKSKFCRISMDMFRKNSLI
jgi:hypothetical protein